MSQIGKFTLKIRKDGKGEWVPLSVRMITPTFDESPDSVVSDVGTFDTPEQAQEAKTNYLEEHPGVECCIFKTVKNEDGEIEDINVDSLLEDSD